MLSAGTPWRSASWPMKARPFLPVAASDSAPYLGPAPGASPHRVPVRRGGARCAIREEDLSFRGDVDLRRRFAARSTESARRGSSPRFPGIRRGMPVVPGSLFWSNFVKTIVEFLSNCQEAKHVRQ
ncbi:hypothetical protein AvCA_34540 [Azotobacter vinelandii CA]|uniref:Uncharacterized protein n=2 Tax=Azotobacter vinelandii TaxID=354 RepID=C1DQG7_AZOVD|nr:hypothetical protein Avin_34540 [Azotobacter vinelandii DJ]AGK16300.1 hypothetical protein AvCA_34540 [Azotobacter vinelandii CA]AGK21350.1 hypothetical protein AvCA6_34540 [Azotobacter vinelandii CA6]